MPPPTYEIKSLQHDATGDTVTLRCTCGHVNDLELDEDYARTTCACGTSYEIFRKHQLDVYPTGPDGRYRGKSTFPLSKKP